MIGERESLNAALKLKAGNSCIIRSIRSTIRSSTKKKADGVMNRHASHVQRSRTGSFLTPECSPHWSVVICSETGIVFTYTDKGTRLSISQPNLCSGTSKGDYTSVFSAATYNENV